MSFAALLQGIEFLAGLVMTQQQIQIEVIKSKINSLVSQHEDEFKAITDINKLFVTLQSQSVLSQNLSNLSEQLLLTWSILAKDIDDKVKLEQKLTSDYKDVQKSKQSFTLNDGLFLSFGAIGSAYKLYSLQKTLSSVKADTPQKCINEMKGTLMKEKIIVQRINIVDENQFKARQGQTQLEMRQMKKGKGSIQSTSQVQVSQRLQSALQAPIQSSLWSKVKSFGSNIGKKLLKGLNALGFLAMMYGIYSQNKAIDNLLSQLKKMNDQYGDNGHFKVTEVEIINLLITSAQLMSNLSYASFSTVLLIKNSYLLMAMTHTNLNAFLLDKAQTMKPENFSVGINFCQASNQLYKTLNSIQVDNSSSNEIMRSALQKSRDLLKDYINKWNPMLTFTNLAKQIGDFSIQNSIFLKKQLVTQTYYSDFDRQIIEMFDDRRTELMKSDQRIVRNICRAYLIFLTQSFPENKYDSNIVKYEQIFTKIDSGHLQVIGNIIASFTNLIFSQSINGDILFKKKLSEYKTNQRFGDDLTKFNSLINTIPIPFSKLQEKNQTIQLIKKQVQKVIHNHPQKKINVYSSDYSIIDTNPVIFWKENKQAMIINGKPVSKIQFKKGIIYKVIDQATHMVKFIQFNEVDSSWQGNILAA